MQSSTQDVTCSSGVQVFFRHLRRPLNVNLRLNNTSHKQPTGRDSIGKNYYSDGIMLIKYLLNVPFLARPSGGRKGSLFNRWLYCLGKRCHLATKPHRSLRNIQTPTGMKTNPKTAGLGHDETDDKVAKVRNRGHTVCAEARLLVVSWPSRVCNRDNGTWTQGADLGNVFSV